MPANPTTQRMGELHEIFLAEVNGGTKTRSSGNQWYDQGDGRDNHDAPFAYCWDGKSTRGKQIAVTLDMLAKIREQAQGERPQIGLRWYGNDALDTVLEDWIAVPAADFEEMKLAAIQSALAGTEIADLRDQAGMTDSLQDTLGKAEEDLIGVRSELGETRDHRDHLREENERLRAQLAAEAESALVYRRDLEQARHNYAGAMTMLEEARSAAAATSAPGAGDGTPGLFVPPYVPMLPWTVIYQMELPGRRESAGMHYDASGRVTHFEVQTVRIERSLGSGNRPRLIVNDKRVADGDWYLDGKLNTRAWDARPDAEVG
jgi:hypothetical protein